jgi:hypothetical protein
MLYFIVTLTMIVKFIFKFNNNVVKSHNWNVTKVLKYNK